MDYSEIMQNLKKETAFDLYRLQVAITQELESPQRTRKIRKRLKIGQQITYFDDRENRLIKAKVLKMKRTKVLVEHIDDKERWNIPFYYVNVDSVDTDISVFRKRRLDKTQLSVGDRVGFQDRQNNGIYGEIIRLNRKTVTLVTDKKHQWRVGYGALYRVIDGEKQDPNLLEGEIIDF